MKELKERSSRTLSDAIRIALMIAVKEKHHTLSYLLEMAMLEAEVQCDSETYVEDRIDSQAS